MNHGRQFGAPILHMWPGMQSLVYHWEFLGTEVVDRLCVGPMTYVMGVG